MAGRNMLLPGKSRESQERGNPLTISTSRSPMVDLPTRLKNDKPATDSIEVKPVQGIMPGSKEEYWIALWLYKYGYKFQFQKWIWGGRALRGGQIIDFWIYTYPLPTVLFHHGEYWHGGKSWTESEYKLNQIRKRFKGEILKAVAIWDYQIPTFESVGPVLRSMLPA
jgi:hypothetical protein